MTILHTVAEVRRHLAARRRDGRLALVPTMGALHEGHTALFRAARGGQGGGHVVATIFVNPTQFNDPIDLATYPRQEIRDAEIAASFGVDTLFVPAASEIYGARDDTRVEVSGAAEGFEGAFRPGYFVGVATVCLKLFNIVQPDIAVFGQKDAQQVAVVRQVVRDFHLDLEVVVVRTVRDSDGLALSSRNVRLSKEERLQALAIPRALAAGVAAYAAGADPAAAARSELDGLSVDYADVATFDDGPTLVVAARVGKTRLIDNVPLDRPELAGFA